MTSFILQRLCTWFPVRSRIADAMARRRPQRALTAAAQAQPILQKLRRDGVAMLPAFLDAAVVERIKQHFVDAPLLERFGQRRKGFSLASVPPDLHVAEYSTPQVLSQPDILALTHHPLLLDVATAYLGCRPTISSMSVWWSLPGGGPAQEAENYHRDVDDWRFVKFFLYLTDVDSESGPHRFVRGSHRSSRFLRIRRIDDAEVARAFATDDQLLITGRAGDAFMEDTFGLHKGQPARVGNRLVLQIQYSINQIPVYDYVPVAMPRAMSALDEYLIRLYVRS